MAHDPSRRLFLSGLPPEVTRRDIVDFVKKRTRANPMYIEIAKNEEGGCKGYAHATVEGLKSVVETLDGIPLNGHRIHAAAANPHWSVPIVKAKKEREDAEIAEKDAKYAAKLEAADKEKQRRKEQAALVKAVLEAPSDDDEGQDKEEGEKSSLLRFVVRPPADPSACPSPGYYHGTKLKFATTAAEIAAKSRELHREATAGAEQQYHQHQHRTSYGAGHEEGTAGESSGRGWGRGGRGDGRGRGGAYGRGRGRGGADAAGEKRPRDGKAVKFSQDAAPAVPPQPTAAPPVSNEPTKEAKKLANLQAKLAALKQKLGK